jgi:hypothetical protein
MFNMCSFISAESKQALVVVMMVMTAIAAGCSRNLGGPSKPGSRNLESFTPSDLRGAVIRYHDKTVPLSDREIAAFLEAVRGADRSVIERPSGGKPVMLIFLKDVFYCELRDGYEGLVFVARDGKAMMYTHPLFTELNRTTYEDERTDVVFTKLTEIWKRYAKQQTP